MRKLLLLSLGLSVLTSYARQISPQEAANAANEFINNQITLTRGEFKLTPVDQSNQPQPYYAFNAADDNGFVIISGDDRFSKVLGYSDRGSFDFKHMPPQLKAMLDQFAENSAKPSNFTSTHSSWNTTFSTRAEEGVLLETAEWNQGAPFNLKAPEFEGYRAPIGCVATALAIIMKFNEYPVKAATPVDHIWYSAGVKHSYDFSKMNLDYSLMKDKYDENDQLTKQEENAISEILYASAAIVNMQFGNGASSANIANRVKKLQTIFGFSSDCQYLSRMYFDSDRWNNLIKAQLNGNMPVLYEGKSKNWVGHVFVIDGYDSEGLYHVNWGWGGYENGYFHLDELNSYSENQGMFINMVPDEVPSSKIDKYSTVWVDDGNTNDMAGYGKSLGLGISVADIEQDTPFDAFVGVRNIPDKFHGKEALALVDASGEIIEVSERSMLDLDCDVFDWMTENGQDFICYGVGHWSGVTFNSVIKEDYNLAYVTKEDNSEEWKFVTGTLDAPTSIPVKGNKPSIVDLTYNIHGDSSKVRVTEPSSPLLYGTPLFHSIEVEDGIVAIYVNGVLDNFITCFRKQNDFQWMTGDKYIFDLYYMPYNELIDKSYHVSSPGSLNSMISAEDRMKIGTIHISGDVNFQDIETAGDLPFLTCLDLENAHFIAAGANRENFIPAYSLHNDDFRNERRHSPGYERIILPKNLKGFEQLAIEPWNVDALDIPASVDTYVYGSLHQSPSFSSLGFVNVQNPKPVDLEGHNFLHSNKLMLFVPEGSKEAYSNHPDWSSLFYEIREVTPDNPYIGEYVDDDNARYLILTDFAALVGFKGKVNT
ncbi:MAG: C10 family peptidase, partial [Muribaculaceae bacterium]|nr:C10 family peptidase [Muribaculaceae bacterium]